MKDDEMNEVHNQIIGWTNNCDTKSSIILAFIGVLVSIAFTSDYILQTIESQIQNIICYWNDGIGSFSLPATLMFLFLLCFTILIGVSSVYSIAALTANIKCKDDSIIFFGKITTKTKEEYIEQAQNISDEEYKNIDIELSATKRSEKDKSYNSEEKNLYPLRLTKHVCNQQIFLPK